LASGDEARKSKRRGVERLSFRAFVNLGKTYPMGVLALLAPEPEVSTRITPDWSVKYMLCPVVAAVIGVAVIV
jgi:hypothetical protein